MKTIEIVDETISEKDFEALLKSRATELNTYLEAIDLNVNIDETMAIAHCHFIRLNANGQARFNDFARFLANKIIDSSIPQSQIQEAVQYLHDTGSTSKLAELRTIAANLFTALKKSGEGGEILLYILLETIL